MPELLIEILSEEIPARMQARAAADLKRLVTAGLKDAGLEFTSADAFVTPRRLALVVEGVPEKQPDVSEEKRGPKVDAPEQAVNGFKGSLPDDAVIEERETPKGTFFFATIDKKGIPARDIIFSRLKPFLDEMTWPKSMRWGQSHRRWVRPIHSIVLIFNDEIIEGGLAEHGFGATSLIGPKEDRPEGVISVGGLTLGHRFLAPEPFSVSNFADYKQKLFDAKVMLDPADRSAKIETDAKALAEEAGVKLKDDPGLLAEVTGLVEWPIVLMGIIEDQFMGLPDEVLITSMRSHQKYFACLNADGALANKFIVVANTETADGGAQIVAGNERVLRARLSDAKFFWDQDRAKTLESRVDVLKDRVFHAQLLTLLEKVDRVASLAGYLAEDVGASDAKLAQRAALLAKADLSTGMVAEFPDLQGLMGQYYALNDGEDVTVARAIAEHYSPVGPNDACPTAPISVCVALADKIDTLVGFFGIKEKPTGSKDPYALRRSALGVIRLILENDIRIKLRDVIGFSQFLYDLNHFDESNDSRRKFNAGEIGWQDVERTKLSEDVESLLPFFADRLKVHLKERGTSHDLIDAVISQGTEDDLVRLMKRVHALQEFLSTEDGKNLLAGWRRAANILKIEEKKDGMSYTDAADAALFDRDEERALADQLAAIGPDVSSAVADERFQDAMQAIAGLRAPVDAFFDKVTVNADDPALRANRLKLLNGIRSALDGVADFSKIEGG